MHEQHQPIVNNVDLSQVTWTIENRMLVVKLNADGTNIIAIPIRGLQVALNQMDNSDRHSDHFDPTNIC